MKMTDGVGSIIENDFNGVVDQSVQWDFRKQLPLDAVWMEPIQLNIVRMQGKPQNPTPKILAISVEWPKFFFTNIHLSKN